jgi:signal transduction histidine kinase
MTIQRELVRLVAACVVPCALAAALLTAYSYQRERAMIEQRTLETARALTQAVDRELVRGQAALEVLARSSSLASGDIAGFRRQAQEVLDLLPGDIIVLSDASGQQLINTQLPSGDPLPRRARLDELRSVFETGRPAISDLFIGALGRPLISLDVPVHRVNQVRFCLSLGFYPDRLGSILTEQKLPPGWVAAIFDRSGSIAARTHEAARYIGQKGSPALVQRMAEVAEGWVDAPTLEGDLVTGVFSRSRLSNWSVAIGIPRGELTGYLWARIAWIIGGTLVLMVSGIALAHVISSRISGAVVGLIPPAAALAHGERVVVPRLPLVEVDAVGHALQRASEVLRDREEVLAMVSHDLRSPIAAIVLNASATKREAAKLPSGHAIRALADDLVDTSRRLSGMVDDLLAVAVFTTGARSRLNIAPIRVSSYLNKAVAAVRPLFEREGIALEIETVGPVPALNADPDRILRVFVNLLDNALKFTNRSGRVVLRAEPHPDGIRFSVANSGPAITSAELGSMMTPFWQSGHGDRRGVGLGLSICRAIVEAHGGRMWAELEPGMRVCICFVLPTGRQAREPVPQPTEGEVPSSQSIASS